MILTGWRSSDAQKRQRNYGRRENREIIEGCDCLRLGLCDDEGMYIVPLNFGAVCEAGQWYFYCHGASGGKKVLTVFKTVAGRP